MAVLPITLRESCFAKPGARFPYGPLGLWHIDNYQSSPRFGIKNSALGATLTSNLLNTTSRRFQHTTYFTFAGGGTVTDLAIGPEGRPDAATIHVNIGGFFAVIVGRMPAGTYTIVYDVIRNSGSDQTFQTLFPDSSTGITQTATSSWTTISETFTLGSTVASASVGVLYAILGATVDVLFANPRLFSGSSDLGKEIPVGNLMLGVGGKDTATSGTYSSGTLDMSAANTAGTIALPASVSVDAFTFTCLAKKLTNGVGTTFQPAMSLFDTQLANSYTRLTPFFSQNNQLSGAQYKVQLGKSQVDNSGWDLHDSQYHFYAWVSDGTYLSMYIDDVKVESSDDLTLTSPLSMADMNFNYVVDPSLNAAFSYAGSIGFWNRALNKTEITAARQATFDRALSNGIANPTLANNRVWVAVGDSITDSRGQLNYPNQAALSMSPATTVWNWGQSGWGLKSPTPSVVRTLYHDAADLDDMIPVNKNGRKFILSILIGANDLQGYSGGTSQYTTDLLAYCAARYAAGWDKIALCTNTPIKPALQPTFNTARATLAASIRASVGTSCDAVIDFAADPTYGTNAAALDVSKYADGEHPTLATQILMGATAAAVINTL